MHSIIGCPADPVFIILAVYTAHGFRILPNSFFAHTFIFSLWVVNPFSDKKEPSVKESSRDLLQ